MYGASALNSEQHLHSGAKPALISLDSGNECSLDHWLEVHWLVEEEYLFAKDSDRDTVQEIPSETR